jgi:hypothetical protein
MRLGTSRKGRHLLVPHMNPLHLLACANRIRDSVERIAADTVNSLNSCLHQNIHKQISYSLCHVFAFLSPFSALNSLRPECRANVSPKMLCLLLNTIPLRFQPLARICSLRPHK